MSRHRDGSLVIIVVPPDLNHLQIVQDPEEKTIHNTPQEEHQTHSPPEDDIEQLQANGTVGTQLIGQGDCDFHCLFVSQGCGGELGHLVRKLVGQVKDHSVKCLSLPNPIVAIEQGDAQALVLDGWGVGDIVLVESTVGLALHGDVVGDDTDRPSSGPTLVLDMLGPRDWFRISPASPPSPTSSRRTGLFLGYAHGSHFLHWRSCLLLLSCLLLRHKLRLLLLLLLLLLGGGGGGGSPSPAPTAYTLLGGWRCSLRLPRTNRLRGSCSSGATSGTTTSSTCHVFSK